MQRILCLLVASLFLLLAACGGDPAASVQLREDPGDFDGRVVINPDDFELRYTFDCDPLNCTIQCSIQEGEWFSCESPYLLTHESEAHDVEEGVLRFGVKAYHDEEYSSPKEVDVLVLFEFDFSIEVVHGLDTDGGDFYYEDTYTATCSRPDCELFCQWQTDSGLIEQPCSLDEPFDISLPDGHESAHLIIEACAQDFGGEPDDEHCADPKQFLVHATPPGWADLSVGDRHTCGILDDDSLWCWGANDDGQVGVNSTESTISLATREAVRERWSTVSAGERHTCAINTDGALFCWGNTSNGRLGQENPINPRQPVKIDDGPWTKVAAGGAHSCAIQEDGQLFCWGLNVSGQLGNGENDNASEPSSLTFPQGITSWLDVTAGTDHTCAIGQSSSGPRAYCWGSASQGRLGIDVSTGSYNTPQQVEGALPNADINSISAGNEHTCATVTINNNDRTYCWGAGASGRLGTGDDQNFTTPDRVTGQDDYTDVTTGEEHSCGLLGDGRGFCWGENIRGQLGLEGSETSSVVPAQIDMPHEVGIKALDAGSQHTCAIGDDDRMYCWGRFDQGRLGIRGISENSPPALVTWPQGEFFPQPEEG